MIFKNYECPNGLPPEQCDHVPQLINNLADYSVNKVQARKESTHAVDAVKQEQSTNQRARTKR